MYISTYTYTVHRITCTYIEVFLMSCTWRVLLTHRAGVGRGGAVCCVEGMGRDSNNIPDHTLWEEVPHLF